MAYSTLGVVAPHVTAYDEDYPTRSTENYSHALHEVLQDMEDAGPWYLNDSVPSVAIRNAALVSIHDNIEYVFDYADDAITSYRSSGDPGLTKPLYNDLVEPSTGAYPLLTKLEYTTWAECMKMLYKIYYMWETENDPLLIKEKLQELLIAWPLLDTTIELSSELGQQFKVYPSWKNADLG